MMSDTSLVPHQDMPYIHAHWCHAGTLLPDQDGLWYLEPHEERAKDAVFAYYWSCWFHDADAGRRGKPSPVRGDAGASTIV